MACLSLQYECKVKCIKKMKVLIRVSVNDVTVSMSKTGRKVSTISNVLSKTKNSQKLLILAFALNLSDCHYLLCFF